jgi:ribosomal protein S18 acetylase RimI-like enzyme
VPSIRPLQPADAAACDAIVASLPYHFGLEEGRQACARAVRSEPGLVAVEASEVVGFLTWRAWFEHALEITWMAVHAGRRRRGHGGALVERLAADSAGRAGYLLVTTLSASSAEPGVADGYAGTRRFYERHGFRPVWEPAGWWSADNQALLMLRPLAGA